MAVNPVQFTVATNASISDGTKTITVTGNVDCSNIYSGTAVFLGGSDNPAEAISGTSPDASGNSTITLRYGWSQGDIIGQPLVAFNTNEGLAEAISNVRDIVSNVSAIEDLVTEGVIKRVDDNNYEVVTLTDVGESFIGAYNVSDQRDLLELGTSATYDVGTGSGELMAVGTRGWGGYAPTLLNDFDEIFTTPIPSGFYRWDVTTLNVPNELSTNGQVSVKYRSSSAAVVSAIDTTGYMAIGHFSSSTLPSTQGWRYLYDSGNTNFDEFGGVATDDAIAAGVSQTGAVAVFYLPINSYTAPTSITINGTFKVTDSNGASRGTGISSISMSAGTTNKLVRLSISGLTLTVDEPLELRTESSTSKITVNY